MHPLRPRKVVWEAAGKGRTAGDGLAGPRIAKGGCARGCLGAGEVACGHVHQFGVLLRVSGAAFEEPEVAGEADVVA